MLKAMAQLIRPATERRTARHNKSPSSPPPASDDRASPQQLLAHTHAHAPTVSTRRAARAALAALPLDETTPNATLPAEKPSPALPGPASRSSRKRRASELATDARPPTKVKVTQPHGQLLGITNGVPHKLPMGTDDIPSGASTPKVAGKGASLAVPAHTPVTAPAQAAAPVSSNDKRSLRSHDGGSRLKSDLATYFGNYDDVMAGVPKSPELLDVDTPIYLADEPLKTPKSPNPPSPRKSASPNRSRKPQPPTPTRKSSVSSIPPARSCTNFPVLDYTNIAKHLHTDDDADPLADSVYFTQHRRAERKEKQLRNIEKDRAMHEKAQLERLLDGLQGPDWLKVMGITGVTDGERKNWEPKRDYFVKEVQALVDKFRLWKEQEKKQRAEKEAANAAKEDEDESESVTPEPRKPAPKRHSDHHNHHSSTHPSPPKPRRPPRPHGFYLPVVPAPPTSPFTSFFAKPHLRQAALGKQRHGRGALAFGHPVPDSEEREFELPEDFMSEEFLRHNARERRRRRRTREGG